VHFDIDACSQAGLLEGLDDIGMTLKHEADITTYETKHHPSATLYSPVDSQAAAKN